VANAANSIRTVKMRATKACNPCTM
jgi:hypothetical protein